MISCNSVFNGGLVHRYSTDHDSSLSSRFERLTVQPYKAKPNSHVFLTPPKFNMKPEKWWFFNRNLLFQGLIFRFQGSMLNFRGVSVTTLNELCQHWCNFQFGIVRFGYQNSSSLPCIIKKTGTKKTCARCVSLQKKTARYIYQKDILLLEGWHNK